MADTYLKVKDMVRAVSFYQAFLGVEAEYRYKNRWSSITDHLGLYNPDFDLENDVPLTKNDRDTRMGNNFVVVFASDDLENDWARVQSLGATRVTEILEVDLAATNRFFQFQDPKGNVLEVGGIG